MPHAPARRESTCLTNLASFIVELRPSTANHPDAETSILTANMAAGPPQNSTRFEFARFNKVHQSPQQPTSSKSPFLFIVKTPDSGALSRSTTRSAAANINSHAQRWAQETALTQDVNKPLTAHLETLHFEDCLTRCRVDRLLADESSSLGRKQFNGRKVAGQSTAKRRKTSNAPFGTPSTGTGDDRSTPPQSAPCPQSLVRTPHLSALSKIGPLDCVSLPIDNDVQQVLQYYLSFVLLSNEDNEGSTRTVTNGGLVRHRSNIDAIVHGCMRERVHMYALLAATASRMRLVSGITFQPGKGPEFYLHKAIQYLRVLLSGHSVSQDRQLILDIYYLSVCEFYMGSYEACRTHFNVLRHFWKSLAPRSSAVDQYIYDMLNYNGAFLSLESTARPMSGAGGEGVPLSTRQEIQLPFPTRQSSEPCRYGDCSAFAAALECTTYSQDFKDIVQQLSPLLRLHASLDRAAEIRERRGLRSTSMSLILRLLDLPSYGTELCCRLALVLILEHLHESMMTTHPCNDDDDDDDNNDNNKNNKNNSKYHGPNTKEIPTNTSLLTGRLRRQLQYEILRPSNEIPLHPGTSPSCSSTSTTISTSSPPPAPDPSVELWTGKSEPLLLWILTTGLFAARRCELTDESQWFAARARALTRFLNIHTPETLHKLLSSFVCVDEMLDGVTLA